eukprot:COSAG01_NODE_31910_length_589_cov_1.304082_1_plen_65_part_01
MCGGTTLYRLHYATTDRHPSVPVALQHAGAEGLEDLLERAVEYCRVAWGLEAMPAPPGHRCDQTS